VRQFGSPGLGDEMPSVRRSECGLHLEALIEDNMNKMETRRQSSGDMLVYLQNLPRIAPLRS